jgi:hypothetical protein
MARRPHLVWGPHPKASLIKPTIIKAIQTSNNHQSFDCGFYWLPSLTDPLLRSDYGQHFDAVVINDEASPTRGVLSPARIYSIHDISTQRITVAIGTGSDH